MVTRTPGKKSFNRVKSEFREHVDVSKIIIIKFKLFCGVGGLGLGSPKILLAPHSESHVIYSCSQFPGETLRRSFRAWALCAKIDFCVKGLFH